MAQYRGSVKVGSLTVGGVQFGTRPALYEMEVEDALRIENLYRGRLTLQRVDDPRAQKSAKQGEQPTSEQTDGAAASTDPAATTTQGDEKKAVRTKPAASQQPKKQASATPTQ